MKYFFNLNAVFCTAYIGLFVFIVTNIPIETDLFDPISKAFEDFEMSDLVFAQPAPDEDLVSDEVDYLRDPSDIPRDTNIVLVNIQYRNRAELGQMIDIINKYEPKVIGIDAFFRKEKGPALDFPLAMALGQTKNLVLVNQLVTTDETNEYFDSLQYSHPMFNESAHNGFANVLASAGGKGFRTVKSFYPFQYLGREDSLYPNFSTKIVELADPDAYQTLMNRKHFKETINWTGNYRKFMAFDAHQILGEIGDLSVMKDKIVLMGYIGQQLGKRDLDDIFYTPQNPRVAGRAYPDTYGVVVHANIISMIMDKKYIHQTPDWLLKIILVVITYLNVCVFLYVAEKRKMYYDLITKSLQLAEIALLMGLIVMLMLKFQIKINFSFVLIAVALSGDLTELYAGSLQPLALKYLRKYGVIKSESPNLSED